MTKPSAVRMIIEAAMRVASGAHGDREIDTAERWV
jgi:hypothetical protein